MKSLLRWLRENPHGLMVGLKSCCMLLLVAMTLGGVGPRQDPILERLGTWPGHHRGPALDVAVTGSFAYVAAGEGGVQILNIEDPAEPVWEGEFCPPGKVEKVEIEGGRAYVAASVHRGGGCEYESFRTVVFILDITDPPNPVVVGTYQTSSLIQGIYVRGNRLYLSDEEDGLHVVDATSPGAPETLFVGTQVSTPEWAMLHFTSMWTEKQRTYSGAWGNVAVMDTTDPRSPVLITNLSVSGNVVGVQVISNWLYVATDAQFNIYALESNSVPIIVGSTSVGATIRDLEVAGEVAYLACAEGGLIALNLANRINPVELGTQPTKGLARALRVAGTNALVADSIGGLQVVNVAEPAKMTLAGGFDTGLTARQVRVNGGRAFVLSSDTEGTRSRSVLELVDVSDPTRPVATGNYGCSGNVVAMEVLGSLVALGTTYTSGSNALLLIDARSPYEPLEVSHTGLADGYDVDICLTSTQALVSQSGSLRIYDIRDPCRPMLLGETYCYGGSVEACGTNAYVFNGWDMWSFDVSKPEDPIPVGNAYLPGSSYPGRLKVVGGYAYVGLGWDGLGIVDVGNASNLVVIACADSFGEAKDLWTDGRNVMLARGWYGVELFDVADREKPFSLGVSRTRSQALGVDVAGNYAYVAEGGQLGVFALPAGPATILEDVVAENIGAGNRATLTVRAYGRGALSYQWYWGESGDTSRPIPGATGATLETSEAWAAQSYWVRVSGSSGVSDSRSVWVNVVPAVPVELIGLWPGWRRAAVSELVVLGEVGYATLQNGSLVVCDLSNRTQPVVTGYYDPRTGYSAYGGLAVSGNLLLLALGTGGLHLLDISTPSLPANINVFYADWSVNRVRVKGSHAFVLGDKFAALDVSNPSAVKPAGSLQVGGNDFVLEGQYAYLASYDQVIIVDISNPAQLRVAGTNLLGNVSTRNIHVNGKYAYVSLSASGQVATYRIQVLDVSNPARPLTAGNVSGLADPRGLCAASNYLYAADGNDGLKTFSLANPASPSVVSTSSVNSYVDSVLVAGGYAYVGGSFGLHIADLKTPAKPQWAGVLRTSGNSTDVALGAGHAYLANEDSLEILDISVPTLPRSAASVPMWTRHLAISGDRLYKDGAQVFDISKPTSPASLGELASGTVGNGAMVVENGYVYQAGFAIIDARDPRDMRGLGSYGPDYNDRLGLELKGGKIYLCREWKGLHVLDVTDPAYPERVGVYYTDGPIMDVALRGDYAYLVLGYELPALEVVNLSNVRRPRFVHRTPLANPARIDIAGSYAFVSGDGLTVFDIADPERPVLAGRHSDGVATELMQVRDGMVYASAGEYGLAIYRFSPQLKLNPPVLSPGGLHLAWVGGPGIRLQQSANPGSGVWQDVPFTEGANSVMLSRQAGGRYYRLYKP